MDPVKLHADLEPLAGLVGAWSGRGEGDYPTIETFSYLENVTFGHVGKPFLSYAQRTRDASSGSPLHMESGWLRVPDDGRIELVLSQPTGIVEVHAGTVTHPDGADGPVVIALASTDVGMAPTATHVEAVERTFTLQGDELRYHMSMRAVGQAMAHHLSATLQRDE